MNVFLTKNRKVCISKFILFPSMKYTSEVILPLVQSKNLQDNKMFFFCVFIPDFYYHISSTIHILLSGRLV